jgi:hypothetical protein
MKQTMTVTVRIEDNGIKGVLILILFVVLSVKSCIVQGQTQPPYRGFEAGFGIRSFTVASDISALKNLNAVQEGGSAGIVYGNSAIKGKLRIGFYYSSASTKRTINLLETEITSNLHPFHFIKNFSGKIEPFVITGVTLQNARFFGLYLEDPKGNFNYSQANEPYLGNILQTCATLGLGVMWKVIDKYDFVHIFGQIRAGIPIHSNASNSAFSNTVIRNTLLANIGVSFGYYR